MNGYIEYDLRKQIFLECQSMASYAVAKGIQVPAEAILIIETLEPLAFNADSEINFLDPQVKKDITALVETHDLLARLVEPALPSTLLFLNKELPKSTLLKFLGGVPLVRQLMVAAFVFLCIFVVLLSSPFINEDKLAESVLSTDGFEQIVRLVFYICSAGLGASFAGLYKANYYISNGTFEPSYQITYWVRFVLGIIGGLLLAILISEDSIKADGLLSKGIVRPMLAILGGFSADLFYTLLNRLLETFKSLFENGSKNIIDAKAIEMKSKITNLEIDSRNQLAQKLILLQEKIGPDATSEEIKQQIQDVLKVLIKPK